MLVSVKVYPKSGKNEIIKLDDENYKIYLKSEAENNKANIELINSLAKYFNTSQVNIHIKRGKTSSKKVVEINL